MRNYFLLIIILIIAGCTKKSDDKEDSDKYKAPIADFTSDTREAFIDSAYAFVSYSDKSQYSPSKWEWTFENGSPSTSTLKRPEVKYYNEGIFAVSLNVTNSNGNNKITVKDYIKITDRRCRVYGKVTTKSTLISYKILWDNGVLLNSTSAEFESYLPYHYTDFYVEKFGFEIKISRNDSTKYYFVESQPVTIKKNTEVNINLNE